mgnify:FL=1
MAGWSDWICNFTARANGMKSWEALYNARDNAALRAKRKNPHAIKPGDVVYVPSAGSDKDRKEIIHKLKKLKVQTKKSLDKELRYLAEQKRNVQRWSTGVDTAGFVANLSLGLGKLVGQGYKAASATGKELAKINAEVAKGTAQNLATRPVQLYAGGATLRGDESLGWAITKTLLISYNQMTSPSYWANGFTKLWTGQTPLETIQQAERQVKRQHQATMRQLQKRIDELERG